MKQPSSPPFRVGLSVLAYFMAQTLAFRFPDSFGLVAGIWPAAGVALASLLLNPRRLWPALLGSLLADHVVVRRQGSFRPDAGGAGPGLRRCPG